MRALQSTLSQRAFDEPLVKPRRIAI